MKSVSFISGASVSALGQGTWGFGENRGRRKAEIAALRLGLDLGLSLIDTAEMYGDGESEKLVAEAIAGRRDEVFLVSKVLPQNATRARMATACERSLERLATDRLDLYLLHWRAAAPLAETLAAFQSLQRAGKIRAYGLSNFDCDDMEQALAIEGGKHVATDQVLYNLERRGIEWDLLPWCRERAIPVMAYSPLGHARGHHNSLLRNPAIEVVARRHGASATQIALGWLLRQERVIAIPKAGSEAHVRDNRAAAELRLSAKDLSDLDDAFPPPQRKTDLEVL